MAATKAEIIEQLVEQGIEHDPSSTKAVLTDLLRPASQQTSSQTDEAAAPRPVWEAGESRGQYQSRLREWKRSRSS